MATTKAFGIAELIRHMSYNNTTGKVETTTTITSSAQERSVSKTASGTSIQNLFTFAKATYRAARVSIVATHSSDYHFTTFLLVHDGTTTYDTEFGTVTSGSSKFTVTSDISGDNVRVRVTPINTSTTFKYSIEYVDV
jgi:hypothetical protein